MEIILKQKMVDCLRIEALIEPRDICFLNGILEGYDNMAILITLDSSRGLVEILASPCYQDEIYELLNSLQAEMPIKFIRR